MINVIMHIPNRFDATAWYRASGPMAALRKQFRDQIHITMAQEVSFTSAMQHDVALFQRPSTASELEAIRIFRRLNIPVIVDYDDLLFDLPTDNPAYGSYMNKETQERIVTIVREASCVWVSTRELKRSLQLPQASLNDKVFVIPNALDDFHLVTGAKSEPQSRRQPAILWRGSQTHERDVMEYTPEMAEVAERYANYSFVFAGWNPWFLTERMRAQQAIVSGALPVGEFMEFVYASGPAIGIVPLHNSRFNRCKSNIAWLEMSWAGGACLVPDWEEWRNPGCVSYSSPEDFKAGLSALVEMGPEKTKELNKQSWDHIREHFLLSKVNPLRFKLISSCINGDWPEGGKMEDAVMELE